MLDPLSPVTAYWHARFLLYARRAEEAIEESRRALNLDPDFAYGLAMLGRAQLLEGKVEEAVDALRKSAEVGGSNSFQAYLACGLAATGRNEEAREILKKIAPAEGANYVRSEVLAAVYGALGDLDEAFLQLDRAYAERSAGLIYLHLDPMYDSMRDDPRMDEMVQRIGLQ
jgi:tetratricopeptide (TPR) repeat protein